MQRRIEGETFPAQLVATKVARFILLPRRLAVLGQLKTVDAHQQGQLQEALLDLRRRLDPTTGEVIRDLWPVFLVGVAYLAGPLLGLAKFDRLTSIILVLLLWLSTAIVAAIVLLEARRPEGVLLARLIDALELADQVRGTTSRPAARRELVRSLEEIAALLTRDLPAAWAPRDPTTDRIFKGEMRKMADAFRNLKLGIVLPNPEAAALVMSILITAVQAEATEDWRLMPGASDRGIAHPTAVL